MLILVSFHAFVSRCIIIFVMVARNELKIGDYTNKKGLLSSAGLDFQKRSFQYGQLQKRSSIMGQR